MAQSLGTDSNRLATYESGRVPLRFSVFLAAFKRWDVNPVWLATGLQNPFYDGPAELEMLESQVPPNSLFSYAFDHFLQPFCDDRQRFIDGIAKHVSGRIQDLIGEIIADPAPQKSLSDEVAAGLSMRLCKLGSLLGLYLQRKKVLTDSSLKSRNAAVTYLTLEQLLAKLRAKTSTRGGMATLAKALGVPQARVSEWLSGAKEPGGKMTLKLLNWVQEQERE